MGNGEVETNGMERLLMLLRLFNCDHHFSGYCTRTIIVHDEWVRSIAASEDERVLVTASTDQVGYVCYTFA